MGMTGKLNKIGITNYEFVEAVDGTELQQIDHYINNLLRLNWKIIHYLLHN